MGGFINDGGGTWCQPDNGSVWRMNRFGYLKALRQPDVFHQVTFLAVHGYGDLRTEPAIHVSELFARRMARHVNVMVLRGDHLNATHRKHILHVVDETLVSRNDP